MKQNSASSDLDEREAEFSGLYARYQNLVRAILFKMIGPEHLDDAVQEVFVRIWKGRDRFQGRAQFKTWVGKIAHNYAVEVLRKLPPPNLEPEEKEMNERYENQEWIQKGLSQLNPDHRAVLVFHVLEGFSLAEVAEIQQVPLGTVKSRLHYAKRILAEFLKKSGVIHE